MASPHTGPAQCLPPLWTHHSCPHRSCGSVVESSVQAVGSAVPSWRTSQQGFHPACPCAPMTIAQNPQCWPSPLELIWLVALLCHWRHHWKTLQQPLLTAQNNLANVALAQRCGSSVWCPLHRPGPVHARVAPCGPTLGRTPLTLMPAQASDAATCWWVWGWWLVEGSVASDHHLGQSIPCVRQTCRCRSEHPEPWLSLQESRVPACRPVPGAWQWGHIHCWTRPTPVQNSAPPPIHHQVSATSRDPSRTLSAQELLCPQETPYQPHLVQVCEGQLLPSSTCRLWSLHSLCKSRPTAVIELPNQWLEWDARHPQSIAWSSFAAAPRLVPAPLFLSWDEASLFPAA